MGILGNILSGVAGGGIKSTMEGIGSLAKDIRSAITGEISPEKKAELDAKAQELDGLAMQAQNQINLAEAQSTSWWVAGWRPFIGWICGLSLGCYFIPQYLMAVVIWSIGCWHTKAIVPFPIAEPKGLTELLLAMLGMGVLRTVEKATGAEGNR